MAGWRGRRPLHQKERVPLAPTPPAGQHGAETYMGQAKPIPVHGMKAHVACPPAITVCYFARCATSIFVPNRGLEVPKASIAVPVTAPLSSEARTPPRQRFVQAVSWMQAPFRR